MFLSLPQEFDEYYVWKSILLSTDPVNVIQEDLSKCLVYDKLQNGVSDVHWILTDLMLELEPEIL